MPIEHNKYSTTFTGESVDYFAMVAQKTAVGLELKGIRLTRGPVLWKKLRDHYEIPGQGKRKATKQDVYDWLTAKVEELRPKQVHIDNRED